jgi:hypothetical protein
MNMHKAFADTLALARERGMVGQIGTSDRRIDYTYLVSMFSKINDAPGAYSDDRLGWMLGWAQCAVVASGVATFDDMTKINLDNRDV